MKNWKFIAIVVVFSSFMLACKGSKCDCPSFKPKSEIIKEQVNFAHAIIPQRSLFAFVQA